MKNLSLIFVAIFLTLFSGDLFIIHGLLPEIGVRNAHAMAYDDNRKRVVLFGGADESKVLGDTWEWDGAKWTRVSITGPEPRTFPAMAYDSIRRRMVLFGGNRVLFGRTVDENVYLNDTWEWDGQKWIQIKVSGPAPRSEAAMVFDGKRGRIILFGGYYRTKEGVIRRGDMWEWDGAEWRESKATGPSARSGAALVYDSVREKIVLFGGASGGGVSNETWEWDGQQWTQNRTAFTEGRFNCVMTYDRDRRKIIRFGGRYAGQARGDTWEYDGKQWKLLSAAGPSPRNHTAMVYDSKRKKIILFGGHDLVNVFGDTWEWDGKEWLRKESGETRKRIENGH
jgi:hypothetical protein